VVTRDSVADGELPAVQAGIRSCPVNALVLVDGE
jgi:ferredoxin/phthalate 3,4-dioxygenase ferredoxin subunit